MHAEVQQLTHAALTDAGQHLMVLRWKQAGKQFMLPAQRHAAGLSLAVVQISAS